MDICVRKILPNVKDFKAFWKKRGPFRYALTSAEFPPVLLAPEEWIFGNDKIKILKELMQFYQEKMGFVRADFNPNKKGILRPENMIPWKVKNFPEAWDSMDCPAFVPQGHLTTAVAAEVKDLEIQATEESQGIEAGFFSLLERNLAQMGYVFLKPRGRAKSAAIKDYLEEWEQDEADAGFI